MGTTAEKLQALSNTKAAIKTAIEAKGVTVGDVRFADYPSKIGEISGGGGEKKKFGVGIDNLVGDVNAEGIYISPSSCFKLDFSSVIKVQGGMPYTFSQKGVVEVDFRNLSSVGYPPEFAPSTNNTTLDSTFSNCTQLSSINFQSLKSLGSFTTYSGTFNNVFANCSNLSSIEFPSLTAIYVYGLQNTFINAYKLSHCGFPSLNLLSGQYCLYSPFGNTALSSFSFPQLTDIRGKAVFYQTFSYLNGVVVDFPELTAIQHTGSSSASDAVFAYNYPPTSGAKVKAVINFHKLREINFTNLFSAGSSYQFVKELHFPAGAESTIQASPGWATLWGLGAGSCEVIFDL